MKHYGIHYNKPERILTMTEYTETALKTINDWGLCNDWERYAELDIDVADDMSPVVAARLLLKEKFNIDVPLGAEIIR